MLPAAVNLFFAAGTGARHDEATINRDLSFVADVNARCGKRKVLVTIKQLCSSANCIISICFRLYLILYAFDVIENLQKFLVFW